VFGFLCILPVCLGGPYAFLIYFLAYLYKKKKMAITYKKKRKEKLSMFFNIENELSLALTDSPKT
jgi:hypothetical protein